MKYSISNLNRSRFRGVTLVELLVVVAILSVITAIMVPRLRVINKDRNIREAARVVGSTLVKASNRAINDGVAGLIIERNDNFLDDNDVAYAGTRMYLMRKLPPFAGDDLGSVAEVVGSTTTTMTVQIVAPLEHTSSEPIIRVNDQIRLNYNSVRYRITAVGGTNLLNLTLALDGVRPELEPGPYPYVVYRQPKKLESSQVDLPDGYFIDLRLSGPLVPTPASPPTAPDWERGSVFDDAGTQFTDVRLFFNGHGSIDRFAFSVADPNPLTNPLSARPAGAFDFYVTNYDPDLSTDKFTSLQNPAAMWVTINSATGSTNVAYSTPPPPTMTAFNQIQNARDFSKTRQSANQ